MDPAPAEGLDDVEAELVPSIAIDEDVVRVGVFSAWNCLEARMQVNDRTKFSVFLHDRYHGICVAKSERCPESSFDVLVSKLVPLRSSLSPIMTVSNSSMRNAT